MFSITTKNASITRTFAKVLQNKQNFTRRKRERKKGGPRKREREEKQPSIPLQRHPAYYMNYEEFLIYFKYCM